jgi:hypothetical protein
LSITGYRLRVTHGNFKGLWLSRIDASKPGSPFLGSPNWQEVSLHPERFIINPKFADETAGSGFSAEAARLYQTIVSNAGIQTEIVEP